MGAKLSLWKRKYKRFGRAKDGVAAIEFALIAVPFFMLLLGLAEVALMGLAQNTLNHAVGEISRQIRTGEVQTLDLTEQQIHDLVCDEVSSLLNINCDTALHMDVATFESFVDVSTESPVQNGALNTANMGFQPGAPSDIVLVRIFLEWQVITPLFQFYFANLSNGKRLMTSSMMFRNEPFPAPPAAGP